MAVSERFESLVRDAARAAVRAWYFCLPARNYPVFLLTVFAKNEKANLTVREKTALIAAAKELVADYRRNP